MFKFPLVVIYAIVAFNITAFAILLQMDWLSIQSTIAKLLAWGFTVAAWEFAYLNRHKFYMLKF